MIGDMESIRIWRSPASPFGKQTRRQDDRAAETVLADKAYSDAELTGIAAGGFNAIWIHGLLHQVVQSPIFPELGVCAPRHQAAMTGLIARAARHGLGVYLYMQPPRALPADHRFWRQHPAAGGHVDKRQAADTDEPPTDYRCFCTSRAVVRDYLRDAMGRLARGLPGLAGVIIISASEYSSHCLARAGSTTDATGTGVRSATTCPRCAGREPAEVIAELLTVLRDGIRDADDAMKVVAWNWSWSWTSFRDPPGAEIIGRLPRDVIVMAGFERGGRKKILGRTRVIDEYSLSYAGPSEQCLDTLRVCREAGLAMMVKLQIGTTHELATVPSLPLLTNLHAKATAMKAHGITGYMGCWNFGNMLSANTAAFNFFLSPASPADRNAALVQFATDYFEDADAERAVQAWAAFARAMDFYPFDIPFLYAAPTNYSLAYIPRPAPLDNRPAGRSWQLDARGDDLSACLQGYTLEEVLHGFEKLSTAWNEGVDLLAQALRRCPAAVAREELANARVCGAVFRSTRNTFRFYRLRRVWQEHCLPAYRRIAADEIAVLTDILPLVANDQRFGFHIEAHASMFDARGVAAKIAALRAQMTGSP